MTGGGDFILVPSCAGGLTDALLVQVPGLRDSPEAIDPAAVDVEAPSLAMAAAVRYAKRVMRDAPPGGLPPPVDGFLRLVEDMVIDDDDGCVNVVVVEFFEVLDPRDGHDQRLESLLLPATRRLLGEWRERWAASESRYLREGTDGPA